jgi:hypothetical protein
MVKLQCHEIKKEFNKSHCLTSCNQHLHHHSHIATQNFNNYEYFFTPTNVLLLLKIWKFQQSFKLKYNTMCAHVIIICVRHNSSTFRLSMKNNHPPRCFGLPPKTHLLNLWWQNKGCKSHSWFRSIHDYGTKKEWPTF